MINICKRKLCAVLSIDNVQNVGWDFFVPVVKAENHWAAFFVVNFIELNRECNTEKFQQLGGNSIQTVKQLSILSKHGTFFLERIWLSIFYQSL